MSLTNNQNTRPLVFLESKDQILEPLLFSFLILIFIDGQQDSRLKKIPMFYFFISDRNKQNF